MFFLNYLRRELWRRRRQASLIATGFAVGIGLAITLTTLSSGIGQAQNKVLHTLYGVGTDITVSVPFTSSGAGARGQITPGPSTQVLDTLSSLVSGPINASQVSAIARLHDVAAATGALILTEAKSTIPGTDEPPPASGFQAPVLTSVVGVELAGPDLGQISAAQVVSGRGFDAGDAQSQHALVDSSFAASHGLRTGSSLTISGAQFTVIGIVRQTHDTNPPNVYIPIAKAQSLADLKGYVNTIYVRASNASAVDTVSKEISDLMPTASVTNSSSLANALSGSLATTASLAATLGTWLTVAVLLGAFSIAGLLTLGAVSRRAREFGTLKTLGWANWRIAAQILGESLALGVLGASFGIALATLSVSAAVHAMPTLSATVQTANDSGANGFGGGLGANGGFFSGQVGGPVATISNPSATHSVTIPFSAPIGRQSIEIAVLLTLIGAAVAGAAGAWGIARLRPSAALARLE